jgi:hypothetical protein
MASIITVIVKMMAVVMMARFLLWGRPDLKNLQSLSLLCVRPRHDCGHNFRTCLATFEIKFKIHLGA